MLCACINYRFNYHGVVKMALKLRLSNPLIMLVLIFTALPLFAKNSYTPVIEDGTPSVLSQLTTKAKAQNIAKKPIGDIMQWAALQLLDKPYEAALLDRESTENLYISLNQTDCMLFIEEVFSVAKILKNNTPSLKKLTAWIKNIRYHGDAVAYCNRNHYFKDWAVDNINKGLFTDEAATLTQQYLAYPANVLGIALTKSKKHPNDLARILARENYVNTLKLGFIPIKELDKYLPKIKPGDIIGIVRTPKGRADSVHHLGIAYLHNGKVGMIDASSTYKKVVIEDTLTGYLAQFDNSEGILLLRAK